MDSTCILHSLDGFTDGHAEADSDCDNWSTFRFPWTSRLGWTNCRSDTNSATTVVVISTAVVILLVELGVIAGLRPSVVPTNVLNAGATFHVTFALSGIAMLLGGGVFGAGTLVLHRQIAHRTFGSFYASLPPMRDMNRLRSTATYAGWMLITVSLLSAITWIMVHATDSHVIVSHLHPMITLWTLTTLLAIATRYNWFGQHRLALFSVILATLVMGLVLVSIVEIFSGATS